MITIATCNPFFDFVDKLMKNNELVKIDNCITTIRIISYTNPVKANRINKVAFYMRNGTLDLLVWSVMSPNKSWKWVSMFKKTKEEENDVMVKLEATIKSKYRWGERDLQLGIGNLCLQEEAERAGFTDKELAKLGLKPRATEIKPVVAKVSLDSWM